MKTGLKRTFFPIRIFFPVLVPVLVLAIVYGGSFLQRGSHAAAQIAVFRPTNCLGGWKNVDQIAGEPSVVKGKDTSYTDKNSASIRNSNAQVFCGGFDGELPETAKHDRVELHFSWYLEDGSVPTMSEAEVPGSAATIEDTSQSTSNDSTEPITETSSVPEDSLSPEVVPEVEVVPEEVNESGDIKPAAEEPSPDTSEPTAFSFFTIAHAQELVPETSVEDVPQEIVPLETETVPQETEQPTETTEQAVAEVESENQSESKNNEEASAPIKRVESPEGAYFEVLYTLDGQEWHSLGFVTRIANDVLIELPVDLLATIDDLKKVQIALHTVDRFDSVPAIYLDALWLEVSYYDGGETELAPPGQRPGDVIFSETIYEDMKAVVVLRNVALTTLSNVLTVASSSESTATTTPLVATSTEAVATTSAEANTLTQFVSTSTLAQIITMTGVQVELWIHASTTDSWSRIADDSLISRNPQVRFESGSIFWVDKSDASVWRYSPASGGYDSLSLSKGEASYLKFRDEAGELKELEFSSGTSTINMQQISAIKQATL